MSSFANTTNGLSKKEISKTKLIFSSTVTNEIKSLMKGTGSTELLQPLLADGGIVFQYTPGISVSYTAAYKSIDLVHTNYSYNSYERSDISDVTLDATFTANTIDDANRMLAIIHFFRSFTKMNYGKNDPEKGLPPRLLKLYAYGDYMFNNFPVTIKSFNMNLPKDVYYVQTSHNTQVPLMLEANIVLNYNQAPNTISNQFSLQKFIDGNLVKKGYI